TEPPAWIGDSNRRADSVNYPLSIETTRRSKWQGRDCRPISWPDRLAAALAGANADAVFQRQDEDLAVADLTRLRGPRRLHDRLDGRLDERVVDGDLQLQLRQQANLDLRAAVNLRVAALHAAAADVADGHQVNVALVERLLDGLEPLRANDGHDHLH